MSALACYAKCEFCDKRGLPVFVARYAIAPSEAGAPKLAAPFEVKDSNGKAIAIGGEAHYTMRVLRSGYLYVYDEARKRWEAYFITSEAYLLRFDIGQPMPAGYADKAPCKDEGHREVASCVTITDPKNATKVWFGFSDVEWTPAVLKKHEDAAYRKRHMQVLDVKKALEGGGQPHAEKVTNLGSIVTEYALEPGIGKKAFQDAPFSFLDRKAQCAQIIKKADQLRSGKGVILALHDSAGIARELAIHMSTRVQRFLKSPKRERQIATLIAIATIEQGVKNQAELQAIASVEAYADMIEGGPEAVNPSNPATWGMMGDPKLADEWRAKLTPVELDRTADKTWQEYKKQFNNNDRINWESQYRNELADFNKKEIEPIALAHVAWMKSERMKNYFDCCFDPDHAGTGLVYVQTATQCIESTQDKKACFDLYANWLENAQATDAMNLLVKALAYNNKTVIDAINDVDKQALDRRAIPWDNIIGVYKTAEEKIAKGAADEVARLLSQIAGPAAHVLGKAFDGVGGGMFVAIMGGLTKSRMEKITFSGKRSDFRRLLVRELMRQAGSGLTRKEIDRAVLAEMNRQSIRNGKLPDGRYNRKWLVMLDPKKIANASTAGDAASKSRLLVSSINSVSQIEDLAQSNWRALTNVGVRFGLVAGLCQYISLSKLMEDEEKAMSHETKETKWRLAAGKAALAGTFAEVTGTAIEKLPRVIAQQGRGLAASLTKLLSVGSKIAGAAAGLIMAGWDLTKAWDESQRGNYGMAFGYLSSAVLGGLITYGFIIGWGALVMFWLVAALILMVIVLEIFKPNKLKEWLSRCYWGMAANKYDASEEKKQFELALKG